MLSEDGYNVFHLTNATICSVTLQEHMTIPSFTRGCGVAAATTPP
jgi:hypothetical protein